MSQLPSHARVVVIGGGVVGCSILYHLAKLGWKDCVLLERSELTSGSSWHAAGQIHTISSDPNISRLQGYTIKLYQELEALTGQSVGLHTTGGMYLASTPERLDFLKHERSKARYMGLDQEFIDLDEAARMHPLIDKSKYLGALYDPIDGHIDPSGVTYAFAKGAKHYGAQFFRNAPVTATTPLSDGSWKVETPQGTVIADHLVNAAGLWAREVGHLAGIELPVQPMEHHYLITETIPELQELDHETPGIVDFEGNLYSRQEHKGLLLGTYEPNSTPWKIGGVPQDFGHELLEPDLDRITGRLELAFDRIPALGRAGIKSIVNGPFTFGPDGSPMIGPVPGLKNYWCAVGVMAGFCQGGGVGKSIAEWMIAGEPEIDVWAMDIARFGEFATRDYGTVKSSENYARRFILTYPNETLPAMRKMKTTSLYDRLQSRGALMGDSFGLEHVLWFADTPEKAIETPSLRRSNAFHYVAQEVAAVRTAVGAIEIANFSKHEITGPGAEAFLDYLLPTKLPKTGRLKLTPLLTPQGRLYGDLTVAKLGEQRYMLFGSGMAQEAHRRWIESHLPGNGVNYRNRSDDFHGMALSGPNARTLLSRLTRDDVSADTFAFRDIKETVVAGVPAILARVSFSGELGYEIYVAPQYQLRLFEEIELAGQDLGLKLYGSRALLSMRLEKGWGVWSMDFRNDFSAAQAGLDCFIDFNKTSDFIGKAAALKENKTGSKIKLVTLVLETDNIDVNRDEAIFHKGKAVGFVTSGGYAHYTKQSVAMGYIPTELAIEGAVFEIELLGERKPATLHARALHDPSGARIKA